MLNIIPEVSDMATARKRELDAIMSLTRGDMADSLSAVASFESALADFFSFTGCVTTSSETGALSVMAGSMGLTPGEEIMISPDVSVWVIATLRHFGISLKLIDYAPGTLHIDITTLGKKITGNSRGIILSSHFSCPDENARLNDFCKNNRLVTVVEITPSCMCDPHVHERVAGFDIALLSLREGCSALSTGEGGALLYRREDWTRKAKSFSQFSDLDGIHAGVNHKLSGIQCALGLVRLDALTQKKITVCAAITQNRVEYQRISIPRLTLSDRYSYSGWIIDRQSAAAHQLHYHDLPVLRGFPASFLAEAPEAEKMCLQWSVFSMIEEISKC